MRTEKVEEEEEGRARTTAHSNVPLSSYYQTGHPGGKIRSIKLWVPSLCHSFSSKYNEIKRPLLSAGIPPSVSTNSIILSVPGGSGSDLWTNRKILGWSKMYLLEE